MVGPARHATAFKPPHRLQPVVSQARLIPLAGALAVAAVPEAYPRPPLPAPAPQTPTWYDTTTPALPSTSSRSAPVLNLDELGPLVPSETSGDEQTATSWSSSSQQHEPLRLFTPPLPFPRIPITWLRRSGSHPLFFVPVIFGTRSPTLIAGYEEQRVGIVFLSPVLSLLPSLPTLSSTAYLMRRCPKMLTSAPSTSLTFI